MTSFFAHPMGRPDCRYHHAAEDISTALRSSPGTLPPEFPASAISRKKT
ncbi:hypothetical protein WDR94_004171 [Citrobacter amalonaticus]|nr:hypothetical protein [Citrobacter amalonaticus]MBE0397009.1 hypothetical protein [Citrobacter amalonaticus]